MCAIDAGVEIYVFFPLLSSHPSGLKKILSEQNEVLHKGSSLYETIIQDGNTLR